MKNRNAKNRTNYKLEFVGQKSAPKYPGAGAGHFAALYLYCLLVIMGMPRAIASAFEIDVNWILLYAICVCLCLAVSFSCFFEIPRRYLYPTFLILYVVWWFTRSHAIISSLYLTADKIIPIINEYMGWNLSPANPFPDVVPTGNIEGLAAVSAFLCLLLCLCVFRLKSFMCSSFIPLLFLFFPYLFGEVPDLISTVMILSGLAGLYTLLPGRKFRGRLKGRRIADNPSGALPGLIALVMVVSAAIIGSFTFKPAVKAEYRNKQTWKTTVADFIDDPLNYFQQAGVSNGKLGGGRFAGGSASALIVTTDAPPDAPLYMQGFIGISYDGKSWAKSDGIAFQKAMDTRDIDNAALKLRNNTFENMLSWEGYVQNLHVENISANARYKYVPYGVKCSVDDSFAGDTYIKAPESRAYELTYAPFVEATRYHMDYGSFDYGENTSDYKYQEFVKQEYLYVPDKVRDAFSNVESEYLLSGSHLSYEEYIAGLLSRNTSYSANPGRTPNDKDYAAYFYFDNKKGYCMHYATTAALLLRLHGIPSRFVSGYIIRPEQFKPQPDGSYKAVVTGDHSHAWAELYRAGIGWIPLETTPGYGGSYASSMDSSERENGSKDTAKDQDAEQTERREPDRPNEDLKDLGQAGSGGYGEGLGNEITVGPLRLTHTALFILLLIVPVMIMIPFIVLCFLKRKERKSKGRNEKVKARFHKLYKLLSAYGLKEENEFDEEKIIGMLIERFPEIPRADAVRLINIVEKANFGPGEITQEEYEFAVKVGTVKKFLIPKNR